MANHPRDLAKEGQWRARLEQHAVSGLSVRGFCRREQVTESISAARLAELVHATESRGEP